MKLKSSSNSGIHSDRNSISNDTYSTNVTIFDNIVSKCLTPTHNKCTGRYTSTNGKYILNCGCHCGHSNNLQGKDHTIKHESAGQVTNQGPATADY